MTNRRAIKKLAKARGAKVTFWKSCVNVVIGKSFILTPCYNSRTRNINDCIKFMLRQS
jgi:hypothetical protein